MASRNVVFEIVTKAQTKELGVLMNRLKGVGDAFKKMDQTTKINGISKDFEKAIKVTGEFQGSINKLNKTLGSEFSNQTARAAKSVATLATRSRDLVKATSALDNIRRKSIDTEEKINKAQEEQVKTLAELKSARAAMRAVEAKGTSASLEEIDKVTKRYDEANKAVDKSKKKLSTLTSEFKENAQAADDAAREIKQFEDALQHAAGKNGVNTSAMKDMLPKGVIETLSKSQDALKSYRGTAEETAKGIAGSLTKMTNGFASQARNTTGFDNITNSLKNTRAEIIRLNVEADKLDNYGTSELSKDIGNTRRIVELTTNAMQKQVDISTKLTSSVKLIEQAERERASTAKRTTDILVRGGAAVVLNQTELKNAYTSTKGIAKGVTDSLSKNYDSLVVDGEQLIRTNKEIARSLSLAEGKLSNSKQGTKDYAEAADDVRRLTLALKTSDQALDKHRENIHSVGFELDRAGRLYEGITDDQRELTRETISLSNAFKKQQQDIRDTALATAKASQAQVQAADKAMRAALVQQKAADRVAASAAKAATAQQAAARKQAEATEKLASKQLATANKASAAASAAASQRTIAAYRSMVNVITSLNKAVIQLAASFSGKLRSAISATANALKQGIGSSAMIFSGLQRALQGTGAMFNKFASNVKTSMANAKSSMMEVYAAGFSLVMMGQQVAQVGLTMFRNVGQSLTDYMAYEKRVIQAGVAGAEKQETRNATTGEMEVSYSIDTKIIQDMIFEMQRGQSVPKWLAQGGKAMPVTFSSDEMAQGLYYYSSAIGQEITSTNQESIGAVVQTIMQMAKVTNTGVETAMKGVLNVAQEFGYDTRDTSMVNAEAISKIAAQMGLLANISTMEVSDIVETFKMVGPMANLLAGGEQGQGLTDTFLMSFLSSEVGLRGGNVGRGINQGFQSLLDPTPKMLESAGKWFGNGEAFTEEEFKEVFFESGSDTLKGGLSGFLKTLAGVPKEVQASMLSEMFTTNATRGLLGSMAIDGTFAGGMTLEDFVTQFEGDDPFAWLGAAAARTANSVSGWFDFMKNMWFQFQASITGSIGGPLMGAFRLIGEVLGEITERMNLNPKIGQTIAAIVAAISMLTVVLGGLLAGAGALLLVGRAFAMLGSFVLPFIKIMLIASASLFTLIPIIALVVIGIGLLTAAYNSNFLGAKSFGDGIKSAFANFDTQILPKIESVMNGLKRVGVSFNEFINGVILGNGSTSNLDTNIMKLFGPMFGTVILAMFDKITIKTEEFKNKFNDSFSGIGDVDLTKLEGLGSAIRGFFEMVAFGSKNASFDSLIGIDKLGKSIGIDNLIGKFQSASDAVRQFASVAIGVVGGIVVAWVGATRQISDNLLRMFSDGGLEGAFQGLTILAKGFGDGVVTAIDLMLGAIVSLTDKLADFSDGMRKAEASGATFLGMAVNMENVIYALGAALGLFFGARLVMTFSPIATLMARIIPMFATLASVVIGLGGRFAILAAQIAISTVSWVAQIFVMGALMAFGLAKKAADLAQITVNIALAASTGFVVAALSLLVGAIFAVISVALIALGIFALLAFGLTAIVGAAVIYIGATQGISAAMSALGAFINGVLAVLIPFGALMFGAAKAATNFASNLSSAIGIGEGFYAVGIMVGLALAGLVTMFGLVIVAAIAAGIAMVTSFLIANAPIIALIALIAAIGLALLDITNDSWSFADTMKDVFASLPSGLQIALESMLTSWASHFDEVVNMSSRSAFAIANKLLPDELGSLPVPKTSYFSNKASGAIGDSQQKQSMDFGKWTTSSSSNVAGNGQAGGNNIVTWLDTDGQEWVMDLNEGKSFRASQVVVDDKITKQQAASMGIAPTNADGKQILYADSSYTGATRDAGKQRLESGFFDMSNVGDVKEVTKQYLSLENVLGEINPLLEGLGINTNNLSFGNLTGEIDKLMNSPQGLSAISDFDWSVLGPKGAAYDKAIDSWDSYQKQIENYSKKHGVSMEEATIAINKMFADTGTAIPTKPIIGDYLASEAEAIDEEAAKIEESMQRIKDGFASLKGMSMGDFLSAQYDTMDAAGRQKKSVASYLAGEGGEAIMSAVGDKAAWLNSMELMADAAGSGANLGANVYGKNLHSTLAPYVDILAKQTGMTVEEVLANIPKFVAPPELMGIAGGELAIGISENMDRGLYEKLDTLGAGVFTDYGLDWAELQAYAAGQAISGVDWNLADYIAESYGMSIDDANTYLRENGIDPNAISDSWFEATEAAALTGEGAYDVMTKEMYDYLSVKTGEFTSDIITMTQSEWDAIPPAYKAVMKSMGISTIIDENYLGEDTIAAVQSKTADFVDTILASGQKIAEGTKAGIQGAADTWKVSGKYWDMATQEWMVRVKDLDGTIVAVPAADLSDFNASMDELTSSGKQASEAHLEFMEMLQTKFSIAAPTIEGMDNVWKNNFGQSTETPTLGKAAPSQANLGEALGMPDTFNVEVVIEPASLATAKEAVEGALGITEGEGSEVMVKLGADLTKFDADLMTKYTWMTSTTDWNVKVGAELTKFDADLMVKYAWMTATNNWNVRVGADLVKFDADLMVKYAWMTSTSDWNVRVGANLVKFDEDLMVKYAWMSTAQGWDIKTGANLTKFDEDLMLKFSWMSTAEGWNIKVGANLTTFDEDLMLKFAWMSSAEGWNIKTGANLTKFDEDITAKFSWMATAEGWNIKTGANLESFDADITAKFAWMSTAEGWNIKTGANLEKFDSDITAKFSWMANAEGWNIKVGANLESFDSDIAAKFGGLSEGSTITFTLTADASLFYAEIIGVSNVLAALGLVTTSTLLSADSTLFYTQISTISTVLAAFALTTTATLLDANPTAFYTQISTVSSVLAAFSTTTTTTILDANPDLFNGDMTAANNKLDAFAVTWTATLSAITGAASSAIEAVLQKLRNLSTGYWAARVTVIDSASTTINSVLNRLYAVDGYNATARVSTYATTYTQQVSRGNVSSAYAKGGFAASGVMSLVGEEGPELVVFPKQGYVFTADETQALQADHMSAMGGSSEGSMMSANPFAATSSNRSDNATPQVIQSTNNSTNTVTYNINGDIHLGTKEASKQFFDELDRRTGKQQDLAKRGMRADSTLLT